MASFDEQNEKKRSEQKEALALSSPSPSPSPSSSCVRAQRRQMAGTHPDGWNGHGRGGEWHVMGDSFCPAAPPRAGDLTLPACSQDVC